MVRIILRGCGGRMGKMIAEIAAEKPDVNIVAGIDVSDCKLEFPVYKELSDVKEEADVLVDFSTSIGVEKLLEDAIEKKLPCVLCSTGYTPEQLEVIESASSKIAVFRSANMSLGINVITKLLKQAAVILGNEGFDIEIVEKHHRTKLDAPSGTALMLADAMNEALDNANEYVYDRSGRRMLRPDNEIGISAVRGGTIVGEHDVIFAGTDEVITISHQAASRAVFAKGAVVAAGFICGKPAGKYSMDDVIG